MPEATMHCRLCPEVTAVEDIVDHAERAHPEVEQDATWPDGGHLVVDTTAMAWEAT
jgi:hypothetical protein